MIYHGPDRSLLVPDDPSLDAFVKVDPCNQYRRLSGKTEGSPVSIRLVNCNHCFPPSKDKCDFAVDTTTAQTLSSGDTVCLVSVDAASKTILSNGMFPRNIDLFFVAPDDDDFVIATTLQTSCSKPIYAPFGVRIGECSTNTDFYVDMFSTSISDGQSVLEFVDGTSTVNPESLIADCRSESNGSPMPENKDGACCQGGTTFIKARLMGGDKAGGFLTLNPKMIATSSDCDDNDFGTAGKRGDGGKKRTERKEDAKNKGAERGKKGKIDEESNQGRSGKGGKKGKAKGDKRDTRDEQSKRGKRGNANKGHEQGTGDNHNKGGKRGKGEGDEHDIGDEQSKGGEDTGKQSKKGKRGNGGKRGAANERNTGNEQTMESKRGEGDKRDTGDKQRKGGKPVKEDKRIHADERSKKGKGGMTGKKSKGDRRERVGKKSKGDKRDLSSTTTTTSTVRFVDCNDDCLLHPFEVDCASYRESVDGLRVGDEFCIVSYYEGTVSFEKKLPDHVAIWFVPEAEASIHTSLIQTSCTEPFLGHGQTFGLECDGSDSILVDLSQDQVNENVMVVEFIDGYSAGYVDALQASQCSTNCFNISFSGCGCPCMQTLNLSFPSSEPSYVTVGNPRNEPTASPLVSPNIDPKVNRTFEPSARQNPVPGDIQNTASPTSTISFEPTFRRNPGSGAGKTTLPNSSTLPRPSNPPTLHPAVHRDPVPYPTETRAPTDVLDLNNRPSLQPTRRRDIDDGAGSTPRPTSRFSRRPIQRPSFQPTTSRDTTPLPTSLLASRPSIRESLEPTRKRKPGPGAGKIPNALLSSIPSSHPSHEPTTHHNPGPGSGKVPNSLVSIRPSNHLTMEPTMYRKPGPFTGQTYSPSISLSISPTVLSNPSSFPSTKDLEPSPTLETVPSLVPSTPADCNTQCEKWVFENCVMVGDDGTPLEGFPCDLSSLSDQGNGRVLSTVNSEIAYHENMIVEYTEMLLAFQK